MAGFARFPSRGACGSPATDLTFEMIPRIRSPSLLEFKSRYVRRSAMRGWLLFLLALVSVLGSGLVGAGCRQPAARVVGDGTEAGDYAPAIKTEAMWRMLAARPSTQHIARSEVVKVIVDKTDGAV